MNLKGLSVKKETMSSYEDYHRALLSLASKKQGITSTVDPSDAELMSETEKEIKEMFNDPEVEAFYYQQVAVSVNRRHILRMCYIPNDDIENHT